MFRQVNIAKTSEYTRPSQFLAEVGNDAVVFFISKRKGKVGAGRWLLNSISCCDLIGFCPVVLEPMSNVHCCLRSKMTFARIDDKESIDG
jgi:hypothetical protein